MIVPPGLNGGGVGVCRRWSGIKRSEGAVGSAQEAVIYIARVSVGSRDRPRRVDAVGGGALEEASAQNPSSARE